MGVGVVRNRNDPLGLRVVRIDQLLYAVCPLKLGPPPGDADVTPAEGPLLTMKRPWPSRCARTRGRNGLRAPRARSERLPYLSDQLLALLVQANLRQTLLVGAGVELKDVLHAPDEGAILLWWDGPPPSSRGFVALS